MKPSLIQCLCIGIGFLLLSSEVDANIKPANLNEISKEILKFRDTDVIAYRAKIKVLLEEATNQKDAYHSAFAQKELGFYYIIQSKYDSAIHHLDIATEILVPLGTTDIHIDISTFYGLSHTAKFDYYKALHAYIDKISLAEELNDPEQVLLSYHMLGEIFKRCREFDKSLAYFKKGSPELSASKVTIERHAWWNLNIGEAYKEIGIIDTALFHYNTALDMWNEWGMT